MESTSPGRAVVADGEGALSCGLVAGAGEVCAVGLWASAKQHPPRQSMKTAAKNFLMQDNLTPTAPFRKQEHRPTKLQSSCTSPLIGASSFGCCPFHHCR